MKFIRSLVGAAATFMAMGASPLFAASDSARAKAYPVGAITRTIEGLTAEIWYPARPGSAEGMAAKRYDLRSYLPTKESQKIPDSAEPFQTCNCFADLPIDETLGKIPLVLMVHGVGSFRTASLVYATHLASQGYIVVAADHPGIWLKDVLGSILSGLGARQKRDVQKMLSSLQSAPAAIDPILLQADLGRIALIGHSAGVGAVVALSQSQGVKAVITMAGGGQGTAKGEGLYKLIMAADEDKIGSYDRQLKGYQSGTGPKAFVGLLRAGHLAFTDVCGLMPAEGGLLQAAIKFGLKVPGLIERLGRDGCEDGKMSSARSAEIVNEASTIVLEKAFQTESKGANLGETVGRFADVLDFFEEL